VSRFAPDLDAVVPGAFGLAGLADRIVPALVFIVRADVADAFVQPHLVVEPADDGEFGAQDGRVLDLQQMRVLGLDMLEQRLDPCLVGPVATPVLIPRGSTAQPRS
jgi:hypothetical protein